MTFEAVVFDLGGVVLDSPLHAMNRFEEQHGIPPGSITKLVAAGGRQSAWQALETGRLPMDRFVEEFGDELSSAGFDLPVAELMRVIEIESVPRPAMIEAIDRLRGAGLVVAALTNSWVPFGAVDASLREHFDLFVESWREGVNKPDPEIYRRLLARMDIPARRIVYLDDIGRNLKPGRALGMETILVDDPEKALRQLGDLVGLPLL